jgi:hypothetical protein
MGQSWSQRLEQRQSNGGREGRSKGAAIHECFALDLCVQVRLRQKLSLGAVTSFFTGKEAEKDPAVVKLEELKVRSGWACLIAGSMLSIAHCLLLGGELRTNRLRPFHRSVWPKREICFATRSPPSL